MSFLYTRSKTWRSVVEKTKNGVGAALTFTAVTIVAGMYFGSLVMNKTNPGEQEELQSRLKSRRNLSTSMMAKANKERLQAMFDELQGKSDGGDGSSERYKAALQGKIDRKK